MCKYILIVMFFITSIHVYAEPCPSETPIPSILGCMSCDEPEIIYHFKCSNCEVPDVDILKICPNRKRVWFGSGSGTVLKECPPEKPQKTPDGSCYHCSDEKDIFVKNKEYKNPCPNRTVVQTSYDMFYSRINCPKDRPLRQYGKCYACDTPRKLTLDIDINPEVCPNRQAVYVEEYGKYVSEFVFSDIEI